MKTKLKTCKNVLCAIALGMTIVTLSSCEKDPIKPEPENFDLVGEITADRTLSAGNSYTLSGGLHVKSGATLTIEQGVTIVAIDDNIVDYILIEQGAKMNAQGTISNPIIMTSEKKLPGAWGGLHICGYAPINVTGATSKSEIGDATYGGNNKADNSGIYKYIRIEYTGYAFSEEKESNGITLYGVGNGTTVEHIEAYKGSDDGFEWFGGTVNVKYVVSAYCSDDSFDWTEGWTGKGQFMLALQAPESSLGYECDCLIEADNNSKDALASPISHPILSNLTLVGNGSSLNTRGVRLRAGTQVEIYNTIVKGKPSCLTTETAETETALVDHISSLEYITLENSVSAKEGIYSSELFASSQNNNQINQDITLTNNYLGIISGGKDLSSTDSFFTKTNYRGAVEAESDWTKGWTLFTL